jgi:hypothetical protein
MKHITYHLLFILLLTISHNISAQEHAEIKVKKTGTTKPILQYLFDTYGVDASEQILLNIESYEQTNNTLVLFGNKYTNRIESIDKQISISTDISEIAALQKKKSATVDFKSIEKFITK